MPWARFLGARVPHFHICNGERPGGAFYQKEAWEVNDWVLGHLDRLAWGEVMVHGCPVCGREVRIVMMTVENLVKPLAAEGTLPTGPRPAIDCTTCPYYSFVDGASIPDRRGGGPENGPWWSELADG